jgi:hypothetical protein
MANKKISELELLVYPTLGDVIPVVNQNVTKKLPIGTLLQSGLPVSASSIIATSLNVNGDIIANSLQVVSSSTLYQTGSTKFGDSIGDTHQFTGSVIISGSTTQIGNNTLIGNTLLSGSLTISGSEPGAATNVNIFGDTSLNGALKFLPIVEQLDTQVSASYIFVSGSTKDLYFSQNGEGFNNITRLRWLEGNLYTGLLNGGVVEQIDTTNYRITSGSGIIVNLNASIDRNPYPTIQYLTWNTLSSSISSLSSTYDQQFVGVDTNGAIVKQGTPFEDGQFATLINIGLVLHQNRSTINGVKTQPSMGYGYSQRISTFTRAFGPLKLSGYSLAPSGSSTGSLVLSSGVAFSDGANYTTSPNNPSEASDSGMQVSKLWRYYNSSSHTEVVYNTNAGAGFTTIDRTRYANNGVLTAVTTGSWTIQRCFWFPNSVAKSLAVYYGNSEYSSSNDAFNGLSSEPFLEAPNTKANAIYVGSMLLRNDADFTNPSTYQFLPGGLFRNLATAAGTSAAGAGAVVTLSSLADVELLNNQTNDVLTYNSTQWKNKPITSFGFGTTSSFNTLTASFNSFSSSVNSKTGSWATTGSNVFNGAQTISGSITLSSGSSLNINDGFYVNGNKQFNYGAFYDTRTQSGSANVSQSIQFNSTDYSVGVTISNNTRIVLANVGLYNIQFSAQLVDAGFGDSTIHIWIKKNGVNVPNSAGRIFLQSDTETLAAWNYVVPATSPNDYYELVWQSTDADARILAATATGNIPAIPSIILTVTQVA